MWKDFKGFILRGNVLDLAVAVIIGAAFGKIVTTLVDGVKAPSPYLSLADAKAAGAVTINYGLFLNSIIGFLIVALAVFALVRLANRMALLPLPAAPNTKPCQFCATDIPIPATRCPNCTSNL